MKTLYHLGILMKDLSSFFSPVMLTSRKLTKDKRCASDFRHMNVRIAKINW